jgi:thioesterase domain-containing protein
LPGYLVPDVIVVLPALPLSANGKVDRAALPGLAAATTRDRPPRTPPRTLTERALHGLFAELLDRPGVGVDDDFFALGGHSLLAVRLAARIHQALHRDVPLTAVLSHPTIASLAAALDLPTTGPVRLRAGTARGDGGTLVLVHPVGGTLLCYRELVEALPDDMPIVGCERIAGTHPPEESLRELADRHAETLDAGLPPGPVTLAGWSVGGVLAHAVAAALLARGRPVAGLVLIDSLALRTPEDRATVAASAARLRHAGETPAARLDGGAELLRQYGVGEEALLGLGAGEVREVVGDWARLLELVAAHRAEAVAVPGLVLACGGNPDGLVRRIPESWAGLCAGVRVRVVAGNHLTVLRSPAVGDVAEAVRGG